MNQMNKKKTGILIGIIAAMAVLAVLVLVGVRQGKVKGTAVSMDYRIATAAEGRELMMANTAYYEGLSQQDMDYRMQKKGATLDELKAYAASQVMDFTADEAATLDKTVANMVHRLVEKGYSLPKLDQIVFIKTTQDEECGSSAYTHGTHIYLGETLMELLMMDDEMIVEYAEGILWHEVFHCLTRSNPAFRADMYKIIGFTVQKDDFVLPPSVQACAISNPDVEHRNSYATFEIDGKPVDCYVALIATEPFEQPGDTFFACMETALVPVDGSDTYYTKSQAANFDALFGRNTDYVIDPEECLADNFQYAILYGLQQPNGDPFPDPQILQGIMDYLAK